MTRSYGLVHLATGRYDPRSREIRRMTRRAFLAPNRESVGDSSV